MHPTWPRSRMRQALSGDNGINVTPRECLSSLFGGGVSAYERTAARGAFTRASPATGTRV